ncbi:MAG: AraC family transcriptional regulator [Spirochaetota bacterium]
MKYIPETHFSYATLTERTKLLPFYLIGVGCDWEQEPIHRPFGYPSYVWLQCISGSGDLDIEGQSFDVRPGNGFLIYPGVTHHYRATGDEPWRVDWIAFEGNSVAGVLDSIGRSTPGIYSVVHQERISVELHRALGLLLSKSDPRGEECSAIVYTVLMLLARLTHSRDEEPYVAYHYRLVPVFRYIDEHYSQPLQIADLAEHIAVSPQYLCRLFRTYLNSRPFEYVASVRITKSKQLLIESPEMRIRDVAHAVGYDNESYFGTVFRRSEGVTPTRFRAIHGLE